MRPDVVGMAVAAEVVVRRDDVGPVPAHEPDQPPDRLVQIGLPERPRVAVAGPAHHVRVAVAERVPLRDAQLAHRVLELRGPQLGEAAVVLGGVEVGHHDVALLAARARDDDDAAALGDGAGERAAHADRLVVGMRVNGHQGQRP
jgi:hypothetical protein